MKLTTQALAEQLGNALLRLNSYCVTAESCTGGGIAKALTEIAGSSQWFDCAFVTYSNTAKKEMLGVSEALIATVGAVSKEVVCAMALGALENSQADYSVAVSGIAGPDGGSLAKPVGLVWMAWGKRQDGILAVQSFIFSGDRHEIREQAIAQALQVWLELL